MPSKIVGIIENYELLKILGAYPDFTLYILQVPEYTCSE